jgi:hypothetical protein
MKKSLIVVLCIVSFCKISCSRDPTIFPLSGSITHCPGEEKLYEVRTTLQEHNKQDAPVREVTDGIIT